MIEDMRHLQVIDDLQREIYVLLAHYNARCNGRTDKIELVDIRLAQHEALILKLQDQIRALNHLAGRPVEPVAHEATAVLIGVGAGAFS
jgi:hypothetical protein